MLGIAKELEAAWAMTQEMEVALAEEWHLAPERLKNPSRRCLGFKGDWRDWGMSHSPSSFQGHISQSRGLAGPLHQLPRG